jgi:hypothetical protein
LQPGRHWRGPRESKEQPSCADGKGPCESPCAAFGATFCGAAVRCGTHLCPKPQRAPSRAARSRECLPLAVRSDTAVRWSGPVSTWTTPVAQEDGVVDRCESDACHNGGNSQRAASPQKHESEGPTHPWLPQTRPVDPRTHCPAPG